MDFRLVNWDMIAALSQAFGFAGVVWGLFQNRRALQTQTALEFHRRYSEIAGHMPNELRLAEHASREWSSLDIDFLAGLPMISLQPATWI
jgi:hypothetical protein